MASISLPILQHSKCLFIEPLFAELYNIRNLKCRYNLQITVRKTYNVNKIIKQSFFKTTKTNQFSTSVLMEEPKIEIPREFDVM